MNTTQTATKTTNGPIPLPPTGGWEVIEDGPIPMPPTGGWKVIEDGPIPMPPTGGWDEVPAEDVGYWESLGW